MNSTVLFLRRQESRFWWCALHTDSFSTADHGQGAKVHPQITPLRAKCGGDQGPSRRLIRGFSGSWLVPLVRRSASADFILGDGAGPRGFLPTWVLIWRHLLRFPKCLTSSGPSDNLDFFRRNSGLS